jgi:hypothetical protein
MIVREKSDCRESLLAHIGKLSQLAVSLTLLMRMAKLKEF